MKMAKIKYFCVVMAVLVLYADITVAIRQNRMFSAQRILTEENIYAQNSNDNDFLHSSIEHLDERQTDTTPTCGEWQVLNGTKCICAPENTCSQTGGYVCDTNMDTFDSLCDFQLSVCIGETPVTSNLTVCDDCIYIKLTGGTLYDEDPNSGLGIFRRVEYNGNTEYEAMDESGVRVLKVENYDAWYIGKRNDDGTVSVIMKSFREEANSAGVLGLSRAGFYIIQQDGTENVWTFDPFLHFECVDETYANAAANAPQKRFIFFITSLIVTAVLVGVTTTLHIVQSIKGCLYFPNLCDYTKEIKEVLKPEVEEKQRNFRREFGDVDAFKNNMFSCFSSVNTLRELLVEIEELYRALQKYTDKSLAHDFLSFDDLGFDADFDTTITQYEAFKDGLELSAMLSLVGFTVTLTITVTSIASAVTSAVTTAMSVMAGVGAVVAAVAFIVDIFVSRAQEEKQYNEVRKQREDLQRYSREIDEARVNMEQVQKDFCKDLMLSLSKLALACYKLDKQDPALNVLKAKLEQHGMYIEETSTCDSIYQKVTISFMNDITTTLTSFVETVRNTKDELKVKVEQAREVYVFLDSLKCYILEESPSPTAILRYAEEHKPDHVTSFFSNEFEMMNMLATRLFKAMSCYWGYNLDEFRAGRATSSNYRNPTIIKPCQSPEMSDIVERIQSDVNANYAPCRILTRSNSDAMPSLSFLMYFIAREIIPNQRCYWGFDLDAIRSDSLSESDLNSAVLDIGKFNMLGWVGPSSATLDTARSILNTSFMVSNDSFQNFLLCVSNSGWGSYASSCTGVPSTSDCGIGGVDNSCG